MANLLVLPPIAFVVMLVIVWLHEVGYRIFAPKPASDEAQPKGKLLPYACGEDVRDHRAQPDYGQFFPFAFFFAIMHVVALVVTTLPKGSPSASMLGAGFIVSAAVGVFVLFRR
jgi:NADH-quinone oxidoreductase subunit A